MRRWLRWLLPAAVMVTAGILLGLGVNALWALEDRDNQNELQIEHNEAAIEVLAAQLEAHGIEPVIGDDGACTSPDPPGGSVVP